MNRPTTTAARIVRERHRRLKPRTWSAMTPAVAETGIGLDGVEIRIDIAELLADPLDHGPDIGAIAVGALAGLEPGAAHGIVNLAIADIAAEALGTQMHHLASPTVQLVHAPNAKSAGEEKS